MGASGSRPGGEERPVQGELPKVVEARRCRDVLFLVLFVFFWGGMFAIAGVAGQSGQINRLYYRIDSSGFLCGTNNPSVYNAYGAGVNNNLITGPDFTNKKYLYYLDPYQFVSSTNTAYSVCVDACPSIISANSQQPANNRVCPLQASPLGCNPQNNNQITCPYYEYRVNSGPYTVGQLTGVSDRWSTSYYSVLPTALQAASVLPATGPCYPNLFSSAAFFGFCVPQINWHSSIFSNFGYTLPNIQNVQAMLNDNTAQSGRLFRYMAELVRAWPVLVVAGGVGGLVSSFLFIFLLRLAAGFIVWLLIILANSVFVGATLYAFAKAGWIGSNATAGGYTLTNTAGLQPASRDRSIWVGVASALAACSGLLLLLTLLMIRRINTAIASLKVASQAISAMPQILLFPLLPVCLEVGLFIYWVAVLAFIWTTGTIVPNSPLGSGYSISYNNQFYYTFIYHLFGLLWTTQFLAGATTMTLAGAFAHYYYAKGEASQLPHNPVLAALHRTTMYHLGSIALGSFFAAWIQFIHILLDYIDKKVKRSTSKSAAAEWAMSCAKCCVGCLDCLIRVLNRSTYIFIAIKGDSYCYAAGEAISLLVRNALQIMTASVMSSWVCWLGKLTVSMMGGLIAFVYLNDSKYNDPLKETYVVSGLLTIVLSTFIAYSIADLFFSIYETAVDTTIMAFCEDCDMHGGKPRYAPPLLLEAIGQTSTVKHELASAARLTLPERPPLPSYYAPGNTRPGPVLYPLPYGR